MDSMNGKFIGSVKVKMLRNKGPDEELQLLAPFSYRDKYGKLWVARTGDIVNGASIPRPFWTIIGSPLIGDYRMATVIHDVYCERKNRSSKRVHAVFCEMLKDLRVPPIKRYLIGRAVKWFGPRWKT